MAKAHKLPCLEYLNECFTPDYERGILVWNKRPRYHFETDEGCKRFTHRHVGREAGSLTETGYIKVMIGAKKYLAHRIMLYMFYGVPPTDEVDHKNGDRSDNRILNLRYATKSQNQHNARLRKDNSTGFKCVHKLGNRFRAVFEKDGKRYDLGVFGTPEEAHKAYVKEVRKLHGEFTKVE